jgi:hypothetical protein
LANKQHSYHRRHVQQKRSFDEHRFAKKELQEIDEPKLTIGDVNNTPVIPLVPTKSYCKPSYVPDDVFNIIVEFVKKYALIIKKIYSILWTRGCFFLNFSSYFQYFDNNREALLEAYHKNALFSMALNLSKENVFKPFRFSTDLIRESRNLTRVPKSDGIILSISLFFEFFSSLMFCIYF